MGLACLAPGPVQETEWPAGDRGAAFKYASQSVFPGFVCRFRCSVQGPKHNARHLAGEYLTTLTFFSKLLPSFRSRVPRYDNKRVELMLYILI